MFLQQRNCKYKNVTKTNEHFRAIATHLLTTIIWKVYHHLFLEIIFWRNLTIVQSKKFTFSSYLRPKMFVYILHHKPKSLTDVKSKQTFLVSNMKKRWIFCSVWWDTLVLWTLEYLRSLLTDFASADFCCGEEICNKLCGARQPRWT